MKHYRPGLGFLSQLPLRFTELGMMTLLLSPNPAAAQFTETFPGLPEKLYPCMAVGDYDGDGDLDVLVAASGSHDIPFSTIYKNTGGTFTDSGIVLSGLSQATAAWGDFDGDGDLDLAMTGVENSGAFTGPTRTKIYRNDGGTFTALPGNFLGVLDGGIAWGDYDGDGHLDLLVTGLTLTSAEGVGATRLYRNDGGVFTSVLHPFPNCYAGAVAWGDYNNDGRLDVVIAGSQRSIHGTAGTRRPAARHKIRLNLATSLGKGHSAPSVLKYVEPEPLDGSPQTGKTLCQRNCQT